VTTTSLGGVRVLELGGGANYVVPYATKLLVDLGADVIFVEEPDGHALRRGRADSLIEPDVAASIFDFLNSGKRSLSLNLDPSTIGILEGLIQRADIVIDGLGVGKLEGLGIDVQALKNAPSRTAIVRVSDWGDSGPYRDLPATGLTLQAAAGWITNRQEPNLHPVQVGGEMHEWVAGSYVAAAAMTARTHALKSGERTSVDFSVFECIHSTIPYSRLMLDSNRELGVGAVASQNTPFGVRPCEDGWVGINILTGQQWQDACLVTGLVEFMDRQQELVRGEGEVEKFEALLLDWLSTRTVDEVVELGQAMRIPVVPVATGATMPALPQWQERPFFTRADGPSGAYLRPGAPWRLSRTPTSDGKPAPTVGQNTDDIINESRKDEVPA